MLHGGAHKPCTKLQPNGDPSSPGLAPAGPSPASPRGGSRGRLCPWAAGPAAGGSSKRFPFPPAPGCSAGPGHGALPGSAQGHTAKQAALRAGQSHSGLHCRQAGAWGRPRLQRRCPGLQHACSLAGAVAWVWDSPGQWLSPAVPGEGAPSCTGGMRKQV